jgi:hypothetical protein
MNVEGCVEIHNNQQAYELDIIPGLALKAKSNLCKCFFERIQGHISIFTLEGLQASSVPIKPVKNVNALQV